jgi:hypothetical protein
MDKGKGVVIPLAGSQVGIRPPLAILPAPAVIGGLPTKVEQRRGRDVWRATQRLAQLVKLWVWFVGCGRFAWRPDEATENSVDALFPDLAGLGEVLNLFAGQIMLPPELAAAAAEFDPAFGIKRGPTQRHENDSPAAARRAVLPLLESFRWLLLTEAEALFRLGVNHDFFLRPWADVRADVLRLTALSCDLGESLPVLDFSGLVSSSQFQRVGSWLTEDLRELTEQLRNYPEAVLSSPSGGDSRSAQNKRKRTSITRGEANIKVREYLTENKGGNSKTIAQKIGCADSLVRMTPAWKLYREGLNKRSGKQPRRAKVGLDVALDEEGEKRHVEVRRAQQRSDEQAEDASGPTDGESLERLIEDQRRDERADRRIARRRK